MSGVVRTTQNLVGINRRKNPGNQRRAVTKEFRDINATIAKSKQSQPSSILDTSTAKLGG